MDWFKKVLSKEWTVTEAGGLTGDAYLAEKDGRRLFLKRNSSPFLAVLSAEGIVPKLVWTKRMENGDVVTAQEWLEGRQLQPEEMKNHQVAKLLRKIHHSSELLYMLMRLGKRPITAETRLQQVIKRLSALQLANEYMEVKEALTHLEHLMPATTNKELVVCHGDIDHHNILQTEDNQLYLIDWDNAMIADPIIDYGMILKWYIPSEEWKTWLQTYGAKSDHQMIERMYWYIIVDTLNYFAFHIERNEANRATKRLENLRELNELVAKTIRG
ncbi:phosphotransferase family protein [Virgibacillus sp. LDC-1]|uniref:phosphotransferase family protein n=1 Tax=Virgibacillus sp. LDC-1 TaxID=3039856 RepID=UPI0024DEBF09|nr:phosphotransferase family protein [Virgibacillus sp. LDC-1]